MKIWITSSWCRVRFVISNPKASTLTTSVAKKAFLHPSSMRPHQLLAMCSSGVSTSDVMGAVPSQLSTCAGALAAVSDQQVVDLCPGGSDMLANRAVRRILDAPLRVAYVAIGMSNEI